MSTNVIEKFMRNGVAYLLWYNSKITIKKNWTKVDDFTLNQSSDKDIDISVPTNDDYVDKSTAQTVWGVKTFTSEPVLPSKTTDATNDGTKPATEAQVKKVKDAIPSYNTITKSDFDTGTGTTAWLTTAKAVADYVKSKVASAVVYKWSVATYNDLPSTNLTVWDMYNVEDTGKNYVWNWTTWDDQWGTIDTSNFVDKTSAQTISWAKTFSTEPILPSKSALPNSPSNTSPATEWQVKAVKDSIPTNATYVDKTSAQTISWKKTFSTEPVLPSKTSDATNDWTKPATEAQVYKKANSSDVKDSSVTFYQDSVNMGSLSVNQSSNSSINLATNIPKTQTEYNNLPSSKTSDWNTYLIYSVIS